MTNDLVKIAKEFPKGFYTVTNKKGEKYTCKTRLDGGDLTELMREVFDKRIRQNLLELKIEIDHDSVIGTRVIGGGTVPFNLKSHHGSITIKDQ